MNRIFALGLTVALAFAAPAHAHDDHSHDHDHSHEHHAGNGSITVGDLTITGAFTRATNPGAPVGGGYFTITNDGDTDDRLIEVLGNVSDRVEIHEMAVVNDIMTMREVSDGLTIPAGETVSLAPGGLHLMFMSLNTSFVEGEAVDVVLVFENAGHVPVSLKVEAAGARGPSGHGPDHADNHDHDEEPCTGHEH